ncbi:ATP-dependent nuclease [Cohaesibacter marisflavi]|uniref:ATP-dependent nuclease n=1 Tax=Cohaesibacter marisflavi TaxID=655353 RepID=UPI0029C9AE30|nr:AAA family ATPase [Cohaesibacter marisflavi]
MKIKKITIKNFKAIEDSTLELTDFNVLVGTNGSGKSSILQALHWVFQSGRNRKVDANKKSTDGSTLSETDAIYMPSPEYRNSANGSEYGNFQNTPKLDLIVKATNLEGNTVTANLWIKSARNEGISVHIPSGNDLTTTIRDRKREISAYIPGLAGIPLLEERRSKMIVEKLAAAGDANTVLRNVLCLLKELHVNGKNGLDLVQIFVSEVMGEFNLNVEFEEEQDVRIRANFQTGSMKVADHRRFKPLELAGIGFLQVIQIFSYLVYFRPVLLLVDEPDSHLHPIAQERLIAVLSKAAQLFGTQVILATHSPSVVRALPAETNVIWMKDGAVQPNGNETARNLMGWGLLDKQILLMTEDTGTAMLRSILLQWPDLERKVAIWPFHGTGKLPTPETINGLSTLFGDSVKIAIHRDRDFMMPPEIEVIAAPYTAKGYCFWVTKCSDMESYWCNTEVIKAHFDVDAPEAENILQTAKEAASANNKALEKCRKKRNDAMQKISEAKRGQLQQFGDAEVRVEATVHGQQHEVLGKDLVSAIRQVAQEKKLLDADHFGKVVPSGLQDALADELREKLEAML